MHIGLTYDLRSDYLAEGYGEEETAEFDSQVTIDGLDGALRELGHQTDRIGHARNLISRLAAGDRWELVFNIAEGLYGIGREAQVPAILDVYQIPYTFADPLVAALCLHKGLTKLVVLQAGVPTPDYCLIQRIEDTQRVSLPYPVFAKPVAEGTGKGITPASKISDAQSLRTVCAELLARYRQPVLVETYLPGREMTVGIVGTGTEARVLGTMGIVLRAEAEPEVYSYSNKELSEERVDYLLLSPEHDPQAREAEAIALAAWQALGCRDAGRMDFRCDSIGRPHFLEVNPLAGMHPTHSDLPMLCRMAGISYVELVDQIVRSAARRIGGR
jgi:D-alanine-D-alanine ligase